MVLMGQRLKREVSLLGVSAHLRKVNYLLKCLAFVMATPSAMGQSQLCETVVRNHVKQHEFHGTVLVKDGEKTIYHKSFGIANRTFNIPIGNDTKYRIASITKAFTAVLILQLYEQASSTFTLLSRPICQTTVVKARIK
jgi:CubicO group peptidase (beta-lactamase class C family)